MNADMKKQLERVITAVVEEDSSEAKKAFHTYLRAKTQEILGEAKKDEERNAEDEAGDDEAGDDKAGDEDEEGCKK